MKERHIIAGPFSFLQVGTIRVFECDWFSYRIVAIGFKAVLQKFR